MFLYSMRVRKLESENCVECSGSCRECAPWCIAKNGDGYTQRGVAKGLKVPCLFMITEVSVRCQKKPGGWHTAYTRVHPPIHHCKLTAHVVRGYSVVMRWMMVAIVRASTGFNSRTALLNSSSSAVSHIQFIKR